MDLKRLFEEKVHVSEVVVGDFTFTCLGGRSMLIEKRARDQRLTIEEDEAEILVDRIPRVLELFTGEFNKRCQNCWKYHGENKKYCPLNGRVANNFYCKEFQPRRDEPKTKVKAVEEALCADGERKGGEQE